MIKKSIITASAALCLSSGAFAKNTHASNTNTQKPNIILFFVDDLGWRDVGFNGSKFYNTPNIDKMASEGMIFTNAYSNAPNCAPSRACLMSGKYSARHGIYTVGNPARGKSKDRKLIPAKNKTILDGKFTTIAEALKSAGYKTCHAGKWHLGDDDKTGPEGQGFDVNIGGNHAGHPKSYFSPYRNPNLKDGPKGEHLTDRITNDVLNFIETNKSNPFFVYMSLYAVHTPIQAKKELAQKYIGKTSDKGQDNAKYAAMIENTDMCFGKVIDKLNALNIDKNTVIVFFSDNGGHGVVTSCKPLKAYKGSMYEGGIRVPMAIKWPNKINAGTKSDTPVIGIDLFPTFLKIAGINRKKYKLDGEDLSGIFLKNKKLKRKAIYWHFPAYLQTTGKSKYPEDLVKGWRAVPSSAIRMGDWKLIEDFEDNTFELYNLKDDIGETNDLAKENPKKAKKLLKALRKWRNKTNSPVPTKLNPNYQKK